MLQTNIQTRKMFNDLVELYKKTKNEQKAFELGNQIELLQDEVKHLDSKKNLFLGTTLCLYALNIVDAFRSKPKGGFRKSTFNVEFEIDNEARIRFNFKIVVLFGVLVLHFTGCGTEPEFERDNKNDPESSGFVPDQPSQLGLSYKIDGNNIILNWKDKSNFEDGYQIFKTIDAAGNTELIGTVPENNSQFTDSSNSFIFPTQYQIYTFKDTSLSNPLIVNVDLGKVIEINAVQIDQSYRVNFSSNAIFHKGYRIKQTVNNTDFIESTIIDDIDSREILIPIQGKGFSEIIEVSPMYVTNIDTTFGAAKYDFVQLSIPDLHNIQLINSESFTFFLG